MITSDKTKLLRLCFSSKEPMFNLSGNLRVFWGRKVLGFSEFAPMFFCRSSRNCRKLSKFKQHPEKMTFFITRNYGRATLDTSEVKLTPKVKLTAPLLKMVETWPQSLSNTLKNGILISRSFGWAGLEIDIKGKAQCALSENGRNLARNPEQHPGKWHLWFLGIIGERHWTRASWNWHQT